MDLFIGKIKTYFEDVCIDLYSGYRPSRLIYEIDLRLAQALLAITYFFTHYVTS